MDGGLVFVFLLVGWLAAVMFLASAPAVSGVSTITAFFIQTAIFIIGDLSGARVALEFLSNPVSCSCSELVVHLSTQFDGELWPALSRSDVTVRSPRSL